jgi:hypothetical protein
VFPYSVFLDLAYLDSPASSLFMHCTKILLV